MIYAKTSTLGQTATSHIAVADDRAEKPIDLHEDQENGMKMYSVLLQVPHYAAEDDAYSDTGKQRIHKLAREMREAIEHDEEASE